jgi:uncharacterized membrane protein YkoI
MKINKIIAIVVILLGLLFSSLGGGVFLGHQLLLAKAAPPAQEDNDVDETDDVDDENGDVEEDDDEDEASVSPDQAGITADEAKAAAEAAHPGAKALEVELENENNTIYYEVELDNGLEVEVDAANGNILSAEEDDAN